MKALFAFLIAIASGALGVLAFSPFDYWGLAYVSMGALLWLIKTQKKSTALWSAFLWGWSFFAFGVSWLNVSISQFGGAPLLVSYLLVLLLAGYLALFPLLFAYLIRKFNINRNIMFAVLWLAIEFLRGWLFTGFPWLQLGYSQLDSPFAGIAPLFGVNGLNFWLVWVCACFVNGTQALLQTPRKIALGAVQFALVLCVGVLAYSASLKNYVQEQPERALNVSLLQGNIEQNLKWDPDYFYQTLAIYQTLILPQLGKADLLILPEAALPALENQIQPFLQDLQQAAKEQNTEVMIGTVYQDIAQNKLFNSIINLGNPDFPYQADEQNRYNKQHLVPFGEYVPLESLLRPLGTVFNLPMSAFQSGAEQQAPLLAKSHRFSAAICYEIIFGSELQKNLSPDSDFILTISNDAWFGDSIGPWQHLQMARMRALELGKPVIRATNTGITAFINAQGKILAQAPQFESTSLNYQIAPTQGKTPYAVFGDKPLYGLAIFLTILHIFGTWLRKRLLPQA